MARRSASESGDATTAPADGSLRALFLLEAISGMEQPVGLDTVAETLNVSRSKAYRTLRALEEEGFLDHAGRSGYRLGSRSVALAALVGPRPSWLRAARPVLVRLAALGPASATLHLRSGAHRVLVLGVPDPLGQSLRGPLAIGERAPLTSGCSGTAILSHLPDDEADAVIASRPRREWRPTAAALARFRRDGYALSFSENHVGLSGIAAPLLDPSDDYPLAAVALAGTEDRLPEKTLRRLSGPLMAACTELAPRLVRVLGRRSSGRLAALDVTIQNVLSE